MVDVPCIETVVGCLRPRAHVTAPARAITDVYFYGCADADTTSSGPSGLLLVGRLWVTRPLPHIGTTRELQFMTKRNPFFLGLLLLCMSTLMLQIIQTRILSVVSMYYLAFLSISMAMLGMTAGALLVHFKLSKSTPTNVSSYLSRVSTAFALAILLCFLLQLASPPALVNNGTILVIWMKVLALLAAPFPIAGVAVSLALTEKSISSWHHIRRGSLRCRFRIPSRFVVAQPRRRCLGDVLCRGFGQLGGSLFPRVPWRNRVRRFVSQLASLAPTGFGGSCAHGAGRGEFDYPLRIATGLGQIRQNRGRYGL